MDETDGLTHIGLAIVTLLALLPTLLNLGLTGYTVLMLAGLVAIIWLAVLGRHQTRS
jgi:hypothetical protein